VDKYSTSGIPQVTVKVWKWVATLLWEASDIHLYFNQHYSYTHGAFFVKHSALPVRHVHTHWLVEDHWKTTAKKLAKHGKKWQLTVLNQLT